MTSVPFPSHPFGTTISAEDILEKMAQTKGWEDKYRHVIQFGKQLPALPETLKNEEVKISGCESQVWLVQRCDNGHYHFAADSDARIVKGLICLVLAAYEGKTAEQILVFDIDGYFEQLGLLAHLSPSRSNGLKAIVDAIITNVSR
ncbi:cysteine desulfurase sulfur acceptor subunit CsdE [Photobacterium sp. WH77]|uniref:Cysteine desulfurase sulfur acceptor subunit CsdE n=1 Tax=Photobacterium arenosum TaxID=2774143 RepID=A0ABR9BQV3_9GAMM|nr:MULTISPECIES: cysteine desulfurase sulfur acceptor subunit CsdE [Photobacterium]MBD8514963.1 cysteine desulfurase sulfur acceptor subunit CsdE [Photobacterium arenosum]MBV7263751.1 cysteine desulfurase sulfur acceptor subunit CsdE [Photobacterium sp. WH24]MCG2838832.1 cysteine desulfurase sulfur acceptor subunit CsdE [Photobacterium sp. WH77]MCG2846449.1 cysteine desulfurase sulfur acceptor subunit CsdE [Photobacterium sp. WH80]MDO6582783.1 cysteine desulfurase sulfur acceptor subunit CsdE 